MYSAFTGPGGGLATVNRRSHAIDITDQDVDFIDEDVDLPDDQPNAYVTCQRPPPRKSAFSDMAEYFRRPSHTPKPDIKALRDQNKSSNLLNNNNIVICEDVHAEENRGVPRTAELVNNYLSRDSLECVVPAWRGEAPSPLSPHPARAPPNAFLQFGDSPLTYELAVPTSSTDQLEDQHQASVPPDYGATRSCENICSAASPVSNGGSSLCGGSLGSLEGISSAVAVEDNLMLVSCHDSKTGTVNSLMLSDGITSPTTPLALDQNFNPLNGGEENTVTLNSPTVTRSTPITPQINSVTYADQNTQSAPTTPRANLLDDNNLVNINTDHKIPHISLQQKVLQQSLANKTTDSTRTSNQSNVNNNIDSSNVSVDHSEDLTNEGGLIDHRAKFLTLELVEGCTLSGQFFPKSSHVLCIVIEVGFFLETTPRI